MAHPKSIESDWPEVSYINGHARFIGLLRMGVRGLSVLVFTWATAVLLGGFVSDLEEVDFRCLTAITFVQIFSSGIFDFLLNGKSGFSKNSWKFLWDTVSPMAKDIFISIKKRRKMVHCSTTTFHYFVWVMQLLVVVFVLCPLVVVYLAGLYISTGIALWRLIKHDYGDVKTNQQPALIVLYSLAVAQGWFQGFKALYARVNERGLVKEVVDFYLTSTHDAEDQQILHSLVSIYRDKTMMGCTKDPIMFTKDRNLVTYAVDLMMECNSSDSYLSGVQILGTILQKHYVRDETVNGQAALIKQKLAKSASFGNVVRRLIGTMGTGVPPDSRMISKHAARIVAHVADNINLRYLPKGSQFLSFLLSTIKDYMGKHSPERGTSDWQHPQAKGPQIKKLSGRRPERQQLAALDEKWPESGSDWLVVQGLRIIKNLAYNEDNRRIIINTEGVISKISAPLISEQVHSRDDHEEWSSIAELSLELMNQFLDDTGETGEKFRIEIFSKHKQIVILTLLRILDCLKCEVRVKIQAVEIFLLHLPEELSVVASGSNSSRTFIWVLLLIFLRTNNSEEDTFKRDRCENLRNLAGEKIEGNATVVLQSVCEGDDSLTKTLIDADKDISIRLQAAKFLEHFIDQTKDATNIQVVLKKAMLNVMPKVLNEVLGYGSGREVKKTVGGQSNGQSSLQDIESGPVTQGNAQENTSSSRQQIGEQHKRRKLKETLITLCRQVWSNWYYEDDPDATHQLEKIAEEICTKQGKRPKSFGHLVAKAEKRFTNEFQEVTSARTISSG